MTRDEALKELDKKPYSEALVTEDKEYIAERLGINVDEFQRIIDDENIKTFKDYRNSWGFIQFGTMILRALRIEKKRFR
jgi:hypothetical protein